MDSITVECDRLKARPIVTRGISNWRHLFMADLRAFTNLGNLLGEAKSLTETPNCLAVSSLITVIMRSARGNLSPAKTQRKRRNKGQTVQ